MNLFVTSVVGGRLDEILLFRNNESKHIMNEATHFLPLNSFSLVELIFSAHNCNAHGSIYLWKSATESEFQPWSNAFFMAENIVNHSANVV